MTWRRGVAALVATAFLAELTWAVLDPKGDLRGHLIDRAVRLLDGLRDAARI